MNKVFEDALMDVQAGLISLCLEVIGDRDIDKVYAYCSIEKKTGKFGVKYRYDEICYTKTNFTSNTEK